MTEKISQFPSIKDVPASAWEKLLQKKIYFGHQSIGNNIIEGIHDLMKENLEIKLNIVETSNPIDFRSGGIFAHSKVGNNMDAKSKANEFAQFINRGIGGKADAAALKFCSIDIGVETDVDMIFSDYSISMEKLKNKYPDMIIIHFTNPLTQRQTGPKAWIKNIIGRPVGGVEDNIKRNEYNEMLLKKYNEKNLVFDIAKIQSIYPDGSRCTFTKNGKTYYSMVPEYTYDRVHLNEVGRKRVAEQLLIFLINLS